MIKYRSIEELVVAAEEKQCRISDIVLEQQAQQLDKPKEVIYEMMKTNLNVMKESVEHGLQKDLRSSSGLSGGDAYKMKQAVDQNKNICGKLFGTAMVKALSVSETNSCMGKIVSAPTAGSCGVIPAALLTIMEEHNLDEETVVMGLITSSGFGMVIANMASISGAEGGCQAEVGSASAMAAATLVEMAGGTPRMASHACATALKNVLGLVCDPVAGLVEIPCIKRNAMGVANAFVGAELALAGIESAIPADEVILAMKKIGNSMPHSLKETAEGGLADTPTGKKLCTKVFGSDCSSCR